MTQMRHEWVGTPRTEPLEVAVGAMMQKPLQVVPEEAEAK
jgi:hypothetical protein